MVFLPPLARTVIDSVPCSMMVMCFFKGKTFTYYLLQTCTYKLFIEKKVVGALAPTKLLTENYAFSMPVRISSQYNTVTYSEEVADEA